ncbi:histone H4 transcription factor [Achroia grisella]|uniref:histone H4 transcription factor n=1 Tax=Achroia grisella TaxID=688607 RepID=UPI0027D1F358|nr:histone H4 transcription factor [Achroia grisella]XP_059062112.1 histone H4 transcription factor [Achroia grisella]
MEEKVDKLPKNLEKPINSQQKRLRCMNWLQKQNSLEPKKLCQQNKNDIQFIIQTNADRKNFLLSVAEDEATVPPGVDESPVEPKNVPLHRLRIDKLRMECEWQTCQWRSSKYEIFQKHVKDHISEVHVIEKDEGAEYVCLWDVCGHKTSDFDEMVRHINYHAYHARLLAIGFNARATLKLLRCNKDSIKRNQLPALPSIHRCMWVDCSLTFNAIQDFFDHVKLHVSYSEMSCSWAGCGAKFPRRVLLQMHVRSHSGERLIACYHCGQHFASNRKLCDHLRRQNVYPNSDHRCSACGVLCATDYLLREHARQHISAYACTLCDMSAPSPAALAHHVRYRHLRGEGARAHACPHCPYRAVTKWDLNKHIPTHTRKKRKRPKSKKSSEIDKSSDVDSDKGQSDDENSDLEVQKKDKPKKKYACHMCPEKNMKIFSRGTRLTTHLVNIHGAQWPFGHSRFRYQISEDGMYRLTTTRYEFLEVSKKIVDGYSGPKESLNNEFEYDLKQVSEATENTPKRFEIVLKNSNGEEGEVNEESDDKTANDSDEINKMAVEITMCDVDEDGNIISSEVINSHEI